MTYTADTVIKRLPIILLFRDKVIDLKFRKVFKVPKIYVAKKRKLIFKNVPKGVKMRVLVAGKVDLHGIIDFSDGAPDAEKKDWVPIHSKITKFIQ